MKHLRYLFLLLLLLIELPIFSQKDTLQYQIKSQGLGTNGQSAPFWFQNNQYGEIPSTLNSSVTSVSIQKDFNHPMRWYDMAYKTNLLFPISNQSAKPYFQEYFLHFRASVFELILGARKEIIGNQDSTLSSGGLLFSTNARPIPKITAGIEHFIPLPYTKGFLEIRGAVSHGIFTDNTFMKNELLHHKYGYIRLGGKLPIHIQYGLEHAALWGGDIPGLGQQSVTLTDFKDVFIADSGGSNAPEGEQINTLGDHRISQSLKLEIENNDYKIDSYWQNLSEDGPVLFITNTVNLPDGLWGVAIHRKEKSFISGVLYEYLNTTDQSGNVFMKDGIVFGGGDNYFNNYIYQSGWNNYLRTIGTPFITSPIYNRNKEIFTLNNRVSVHHLGIEGEIIGFRYRGLASMSKNYGTYGTPESDMMTATNYLFEIKKQIPNWFNTEWGISVAADRGAMYGSNVGLMLSIKKTGSLFNY